MLFGNIKESVRLLWIRIYYVGVPSVTRLLILKNESEGVPFDYGTRKKKFSIRTQRFIEFRGVIEIRIAQKKKKSYYFHSGEERIYLENLKNKSYAVDSLDTAPLNLNYLQTE